jgi:RNA polymerase sigma-70 factor, ECF subfamily
MSRSALNIAEIAREHYASVYRFCARRVGLDAAEDAAQETFLTAQRVLHAYRGDSPLKTWLFGIANNECRRLARKRRVEPLPLELDDAPGASPEATLVDRQALQQALAKLTPEHREAVLLIEVDGLTYDEAAAVLGVPAGTVKSRVHHAFAQLRKALFAVPGEVLL